MKKKTVEIAVVEMPFLPMTLDEVAAFTKYKKSYLYQLVHRCEIPVHKRLKGRKLIFNKTVVEKWLTARTLANVDEITTSLGYF